MDEPLRFATPEEAEALMEAEMAAWDAVDPDWKIRDRVMRDPFHAMLMRRDPSSFMGAAAAALLGEPVTAAEVLEALRNEGKA